MHTLKIFKIEGYTKPIQVVRVPNGWLYYIFEQLIFVPEADKPLNMEMVGEE
jgi:hypothetical protein